MPATYTLEEVQEQAVKAGRYFARALLHGGKDFLAYEFEGAVIVVARGRYGEKLAGAIEQEGLFGSDAKVDKAPE